MKVHSIKGHHIIEKQDSKFPFKVQGSKRMRSFKTLEGAVAALEDQQGSRLSMVRAINNFINS